MALGNTVNKRQGTVRHRQWESAILLLHSWTRQEAAGQCSMGMRWGTRGEKAEQGGLWGKVDQGVLRGGKVCAVCDAEYATAC